MNVTESAIWILRFLAVAFGSYLIIGGVQRAVQNRQLLDPGVFTLIGLVIVTVSWRSEFAGVVLGLLVLSLVITVFIRNYRSGRANQDRPRPARAK